MAKFEDGDVVWKIEEVKCPECGGILCGYPKAEVWCTGKVETGCSYGKNAGLQLEDVIAENERRRGQPMAIPIDAKTVREHLLEGRYADENEPMKVRSLSERISILEKETQGLRKQNAELNERLGIMNDQLNRVLQIIG